MNHDVFISYSSQDMEAAQAICHVLEQNEIRCRVASRNIPPGSDYGDVIEEAIKACRAVVLLFSETAATSQWVKGELNIAFEEQKTIIPFRLDQTPLKGQTRVMLNQRHWIDAYPDYKTKFNDLVTAVAKSIGKEMITDSLTPTSQFYTSSGNEKKLEENRESKHIVPNRQRVVLIATLVCLLVAFFGIGTYIIKKGITRDTIDVTATDVHTPLDQLLIHDWENDNS